jgi:hypothetical protein
MWRFVGWLILISFVVFWLIGIVIFNIIWEQKLWYIIIFSGIWTSILLCLSGWLYIKLFCGGNKASLIRELVKKRIKDNPHIYSILKMVGGDPYTEIDNMTEDRLLCFPEGSIVTIVETFSVLKSKGVPEREIFEYIEEHRSSISGHKGVLPTPLTLINYIKYRVPLEIEHAEHRGFLISDKFIEEAVRKALRLFSL